MGVSERRAREKEERRESIVRAAEVVFRAKGLATATMDEIAEKAELSKGSLYLYFKSKDELYVEVLQRFIARMVARIGGARSEAESGLEEVQLIGREYVQIIRANGPMFRLGMSWIFEDTPIDPQTPCFQSYRERIAEAVGYNRRAIERGKADGSIRPELCTETLALQLWAGTVGVMMVDLKRDRALERLPKAVDFERFAPTFVDLLAEAIRTRPGEKESEGVS